MKLWRLALIAAPVLMAAQQPALVLSPSGQPQPDNSPPASTQPTKPEDLCAIEGQVLNALTGEPVKKAHVKMYSAG